MVDERAVGICPDKSFEAAQHALQRLHHFHLVKLKAFKEAAEEMVAIIKRVTKLLKRRCTPLSARGKVLLDMICKEKEELVHEPEPISVLLRECGTREFFTLLHEHFILATEFFIGNVIELDVESAKKYDEVRAAYNKIQKILGDFEDYGKQKCSVEGYLKGVCKPVQIDLKG